MKGEQEDFGNKLRMTGEKVEHALERFTSQKPPAVPSLLWHAMTYSLLAGGKRIRPFLALESGRVFGVHEEDSMTLAVALEMIHTASLIHDDLPCMDDDVLRRGKPTNHMVFGEGMALLAGDALFLMGPGHAARTLEANGRVPSGPILAALRMILEAAGPAGICGGQTLDTEESERAKVSPWRIAYWKTAVLLRACVMAPACLGGALRKELKCLSSYGSHLGVAFQIVDDILDISGKAEQLGKTPGKDALQEKNSFVHRWGLETAREMAADQSRRSKVALSGIGRDTTTLEGIVDYLGARSA
ncbi:MAG: polyprenyl synthetase family protein [Thermovirgaceae bacterium]